MTHPRPAVRLARIARLVARLGKMRMDAPSIVCGSFRNPLEQGVGAPHRIPGTQLERDVRILARKLLHQRVEVVEAHVAFDRRDARLATQRLGQEPHEFAVVHERERVPVTHTERECAAHAAVAIAAKDFARQARISVDRPAEVDVAVQRAGDAGCQLLQAGVQRVAIGIVGGLDGCAIGRSAPFRACRHLDDPHLQRLVGLAHLVGREAAAMRMRVHESGDDDMVGMTERRRLGMTRAQGVEGPDFYDAPRALVQRSVLECRLAPVLDEPAAVNQLARIRHHCHRHWLDMSNILNETANGRQLRVDGARPVRSTAAVRGRRTRSPLLPLSGPSMELRCNN